MKADTLVPLLGAWNRNGQPLSVALADMLTVVIQRGEVEPGTLLPAERALAQTLNVSRGTVVAAYRRLRDQGLASTRHGSGTTVGGDLGAGRVTDAPFVNLLRRDEGDVLAFRSADWSGCNGVNAEILSAAVRQLSELATNPGYFPTGLLSLRQAIASRLEQQGLPTTAEQIMVTTGAQQAIALLVGLLVTPGAPVAVEQLSYPGALDVLRAAGAALQPVPLTPTGVDVRALERTVVQHRPVLLYLVSGIHNPTGLAMPRLARRRIAELMATAEGVLIEDFSLAETQLDGDIVPPIASYADAEAARRSVVVGSLSKSGWSGLRIGWLRAPVQLIGRLTRHKLLADLGSSVPSQVIATQLLAQADALRARRVAGIRERLDVLTSELKRQLPEWSWITPAGGLCLWVYIGGDSSIRFAPVALRHGIAIAPGSVGAADGGAHDHIRLPLGHPPEVLREAVRRLAAAWRNDRGNDSGSGSDHVIV